MHGRDAYVWAEVLFAEIGWIPFDQLPHLFDPPEHFIATANHRPAPPGYPFQLGLDWPEPYRAQRVIELLREKMQGKRIVFLAGNHDHHIVVRELRTEHGWPIATKTTGRPDLGVGVYILQADRQSPKHDRGIPDDVRRAVLRRDGYKCKSCGWSHDEWNPSDPRHLELHHITHHVKGGANVEENLKTLCTVCHDKVHREEKGQ